MQNACFDLRWPGSFKFDTNSSLCHLKNNHTFPSSRSILYQLPLHPRNAQLRKSTVWLLTSTTLAKPFTSSLLLCYLADLSANNTHSPRHSSGACIPSVQCPCGKSAPPVQDLSARRSRRWHAMLIYLHLSDRPGCHVANCLGVFGDSLGGTQIFWSSCGWVDENMSITGTFCVVVFERSVLLCTGITSQFWEIVLLEGFKSCSYYW